MKRFVNLLVILMVGCTKNQSNGLEEVFKPENPDKPLAFREVRSRPNATSNNWKTYTARTVDRLPDFTPTKYAAISQSQYGGWKASKYAATGFFRVEKLSVTNKSRWFIIDPEGYPYIHRGIAVFNPGGSDRQKAALLSKFGSSSVWAQKETEGIHKYGFNGVGAWSNVAEMRKLNAPAYCVILSPMAALRNQMKAEGEDFSHAGWQGYEYDIAPVWDSRFETCLENELKKATEYKNDKYLIGYFSDNELPWPNDALNRCLTKFATTSSYYIAAKKWLDERKGKDAAMADVTEADRQAFTGFYFESYIKKVAETLHKYDPNHLFLGSKFNQEDEELINPEIMKVAGKYSDVISIDHYRSWEPDNTMMANWESWSGKPFMIVEFYVKGEDSGLPNNTGAGWNVPTQADRGYFYQNFTLKLINSVGCVGWHWFTYQDNDPQNMDTDPSNRDSNKGIVTWDFQPYLPLLENMKQLNDNVMNLLIFYGYYDIK
jgi:hypothetical protein